MSPKRTFRFIYTSEGIERLLAQFQSSEKFRCQDFEVGGENCRIGVITHKALDCPNDEKIYHIHISSDVRNIIGGFMMDVNAENISWVSTIRLKGPITSERKRVTGCISLVEI